METIDNKDILSMSHKLYVVRKKWIHPLMGYRKSYNSYIDKIIPDRNLGYDLFRT